MASQRIGLLGAFVVVPQVDHGDDAGLDQKRHALRIDPVKSVSPQQAPPGGFAGRRAIPAQVADIVGAGHGDVAIEVSVHQRIPDFMKD